MPSRDAHANVLGKKLEKVHSLREVLSVHQNIVSRKMFLSVGKARHRLLFQMMQYAPSCAWTHDAICTILLNGHLTEEMQDIGTGLDLKKTKCIVCAWLGNSRAMFWEIVPVRKAICFCLSGKMAREYFRRAWNTWLCSSIVALLRRTWSTLIEESGK